MADKMRLLLPPAIMFIIVQGTTVALAQEEPDQAPQSTLIVDLTNDTSPMTQVHVEAHADYDDRYAIALPFPLAAAETTDELFNTWGSYDGCCSLLSFQQGIMEGRPYDYSLDVRYASPSGISGRNVDPTTISENPILIREGLSRTLILNRQPSTQSYGNMLATDGVYELSRIRVIRPSNSTMSEIGSSGTGVRPDPINDSEDAAFTFFGSPAQDEPSAIIVRYNVPTSPLQEQFSSAIFKLITGLVPILIGAIYIRVAPTGAKRKRTVLMSLGCLSAVAVAVWIILELRWGVDVASLIELGLLIVLALVLGSVGYLRYAEERNATADQSSEALQS